MQRVLEPGSKVGSFLASPGLRLMDKREALRISRELRRRGHRVARDIITRDLPGSLDYARRTGIRFALLLGQGVGHLCVG